LEQGKDQTIKKLLVLCLLSIIAIICFRWLAVNGSLRTIWKLLEPSMLLSFIVLVAVGASAISYYEYHGVGPQDGVVRRGPHQKLVSLTFDDGPSPIYTPLILDILKEKGVKASFFVVGKSVEKYPDIARRIVAEGHDIGNHTYSHRDLVPSTRNVVLNQLRKTDLAIEEAAGARTRLFRPPRGIFSNAVRKVVVAEGYKIILWTASSIDWSGASPKAMLARIKLFTRSGGILLFHDSGALIRKEGASRENTVKALPLIIDYLMDKRGYGIVPISVMLNELEEDEIAEPKEALEKA